MDLSKQSSNETKDSCSYKYNNNDNDNDTNHMCNNFDLDLITV